MKCIEYNLTEKIQQVRRLTPANLNREAGANPAQSATVTGELSAKCHMKQCFGKAQHGDEPEQETCLLRVSQPTGDRRVFAYRF